VDQLKVRDLTVQVTTTTATLSWLSRDNLATVVDYGTTANLGTVVTGTTGTTHQATLTGLTPATVYWYRIAGRDNYLRFATMGGTRQRLAFVSDRNGGVRNIYFSYEWGENVQGVTTSGGHSPAFSADGTKLAWSGPGAGSFDNIWMCAVDANGPVSGTTVNVTGSTTRDEDFPSWSPDGTQLVFTAAPANQPSQIVLRTVAGGAEKVLVTNKANNDQAAFRPDGQKIAFISTLRTAIVQTNVRPIDGGNVTITTSNAGLSTVPNALVDVYDPTNGWIDLSGAGVGGQKVFISYKSNGKAVNLEEHSIITPHHEIYSVNPDGTDLSRITVTNLDSSRPVWTTNSSSIIYCEESSTTQASLVEMDQYGANRVALTGGSYYDRDPAVSPDGTSYIFSSNRDPQGLVNLWTGVIAQPVYQVEIESSNDTQPAWSVIP
jgi:Tol biopolymer transport system component